MLAQQNKYLETKVQTSNPEQLLIMLFDGAIRFCKLAVEGIQQKKFSQAHENIIKVQDIIAEFVITLKKDSGIAEPLLRLYDYFLHRLTEANLKKEAGPVEEVMKHLTDLKETWVQAALAIRQQTKPVTPTGKHA